MPAGTRFWMLALVGGFFASACPGPAYPKCENDDQCKKNKDGKPVVEYCLFGQCAQCAKDDQCKAGQHCNRGRCEQTCSDDSMCGAGQICSGGACAPAECSDAKPCAAGAACQAGRCKAPATSSSGAGPGSGAEAACDRKQTIHFDFNEAELKPDARDVLGNMAKCFDRDKSWALTIEGHCDERGTTDYNLQLGERRADTIRDYLVRLGVDKKRIKTISYGKEKPIDASSNEAAWAKNRRGELIFQ